MPININSKCLYYPDIPNWGDPDVSFTVHEFFGVIDTDGFTTMSYAASSGDWGADDFTFATSPVSAVPIPAAVWLFCSGLIGLAGLAKRKA